MSIEGRYVDVIRRKLCRFQSKDAMQVSVEENFGDANRKALSRYQSKILVNRPIEGNLKIGQLKETQKQANRRKLRTSFEKFPCLQSKVCNHLYKRKILEKYERENFGVQHVAFLLVWSLSAPLMSSCYTYMLSEYCVLVF